MSEITSQYVELKVADGTSMRAWFSSPPEKEVRAGLMVFQEAFGVNEHIRSVADRFARAGYAALAPELYHRDQPGFEGKYDDSAPSVALAKQLTNEGLENDIRATHGFLRERVGSKIVSTGYCMGGRVSFLANATVPIQAAASYYGGGLPDVIGRAAKCSAPMLFFWGDQDKHITAEHRQKVAEGMQASPHPSVQVTFSDADHGFFCDLRPSYNPAAAELSWDLTLSFFEQYLSR
jgi:carboxymethylenebutenolidase